MKKSLAGILLLSSAALFAFAPMPQAWVYEMTSTDLRTQEAEVNELIVTGDRAKIAMGGSGQPEGDANFLGDVEGGQMIYNNHEDRTFIRIDQEMVEELAGQMGDMQKQMEEALSSLPEAQRRVMMERMQNGGIPGMPDLAGMMNVPEIEFQRTEERDTRAGYPCVKYLMLTDGVVTQEMWMTEWSNVDGAEAVRSTFTKMSQFMRDLRDKIPGGQMFGGQDFMSNMPDDRFAVVTVELRDGQPVRETTLTNVSQREVSLDSFGPAEGYREQRIGMQ